MCVNALCFQTNSASDIPTTATQVNVTFVAQGLYAARRTQYIRVCMCHMHCHETVENTEGGHCVDSDSFEVFVFQKSDGRT